MNETKYQLSAPCRHFADYGQQLNPRKKINYTRLPQIKLHTPKYNLFHIPEDEYSN